MPLDLVRAAFSNGQLPQVAEELHGVVVSGRLLGGDELVHSEPRFGLTLTEIREISLAGFGRFTLAPGTLCRGSLGLLPAPFLHALLCRGHKLAHRSRRFAIALRSGWTRLAELSQHLGSQLDLLAPGEPDEPVSLRGVRQRGDPPLELLSGHRRAELWASLRGYRDEVIVDTKESAKASSGAVKSPKPAGTGGSVASSSNSPAVTHRSHAR